jgi:hypothetical protein
MIWCLMDQSKLNATCKELTAITDRFFIFELRDRLGFFPSHVRTMIRFEDEGGQSHFTEINSVVEIGETLEESYQEEIKRRAISEVNDIIKNRKQEK